LLRTLGRNGAVARAESADASAKSRDLSIQTDERRAGSCLLLAHLVGDLWSVTDHINRRSMPSIRRPASAVMSLSLWQARSSRRAKHN